MCDVFCGSDASQIASIQLILTARKIGFVELAEADERGPGRFRTRIMVPPAEAERAQKALRPMRELLFLAALPA